MNSSLRSTPLLPEHQRLGAKLIPFGGWQMPLQYQGVLAEHRAVRTGVGVFDISHMGKVKLQGPQVRAQLAKLVPSQLDNVPVGGSRYTVLLNENGGIIDDLILYNLGTQAGEETWLTIVNGATTAKDLAWLQAQLPDLKIELLEEILLAVQGPQAAAVLASLLGPEVANLGRFAHGMAHFLDVAPLPSEIAAAEIFVARTGYTGEDGFEVMLPVAAGQKLWALLLAAGVVPIGLGARDTLRLEAALPLYGQDITEATTPLAASLGWLVNSPEDYVGRAALVQQKAEGVAAKLVCLQMQGRAIARSGYEIWQGDQKVGTITSGTKSPTLGVAIAMGYLPSALAKVGTPVEVDIRGQRSLATVVKRPFYRPAE